MASGSVLNAFLDFISGTGVARITAADHPVHLATKHVYMWPRLWKNNGQPMDGGQNISFWFIPKDNGTFEEVLDGTPTTPKNTQVLQKGVADWRKTRAHAAWADSEILLNDRITYGTKEAMFEQFVKIRDEKMIIAEAAIGNGLENQLFARPNKTLMEGLGQNATSPYSLFAHVNECSNGLFGSNYGFVLPEGAWTVKQTIDPTASVMGGQLTPAVVKYSTATPDNPGNIIGGLDRLWNQVGWEQPDNLTKYAADERLNNQIIMCTIQGRAAIQSLMRGDQDRYISGPQDPAYPDPQFHGVPLKRADGLETAVVYDGGVGVGLVTEGSAVANVTLNTNAGPRFYLTNGNFIHPIAHRERLFFKDTPIRHPQIPDTWVQYYATWWQLVCKSYKHQGVLVPNNTAGGFYTGNNGTPNLYV